VCNGPAAAGNVCRCVFCCATFNDDVAGLVALSLKQPVRLAADAAAAAPSTLSQEVGCNMFYAVRVDFVVASLCHCHLQAGVVRICACTLAGQRCAMAQRQRGMFAAAVVVLGQLRSFEIRRLRCCCCCSVTCRLCASGAQQQVRRGQRRCTSFTNDAAAALSHACADCAPQGRSSN
jgi:hypothetical protein